MKNPNKIGVPFRYLCVSLFIAFFILASAFYSNKAYGAALSGTYTVCSSGCDYTDFGKAVYDLERYGVSGPVTFNMKAGINTGGIQLIPISGVSATNTITFNGAGMYSTIITYGTASVYGVSTLKLMGSKYITFKNLAITDTLKQSGFGYCVYIDSASYCSFDHCRFSAPLVSNKVNGPDIYNVQSMQMMEHCTFTNNRFEGGYMGFVFGGGTTTAHFGNNIIKNNRFIQFSNYGIDAASYGTYGNVYANNVFDSALWIGAVGILIDYENGVSVTGNVLNKCNILLASLNSNDSSGLCDISNNMVRLANTLYSSGFAAGSSTGHVRVAHNTVYLPSSDSALNGVNIYFTGKNIDVLNNIFDIRGYTSATPIYISGKGTYRHIDGNDYYTGSNYNVIFLDKKYNSYKSMFAYAVSHNIELRSSGAAPVYKNAPSDLHLDHTVSNPNGMYANIAYDIDGDPRCTLFPSAGADESPYGKSAKPASAHIAAMGAVYDGNPMTFYDSAGPAYAVTYKWYVNGKFVSDSIALVSIPYVSSGITVALVTENCAGKDSSYRTFQVLYPSKAPLADFTADHREIEINDTLRLKDLSTNGPSAWQWQITPAYTYVGGVKTSTYKYIYGTSSTSQDPILQFNSPGRYKVCLTATNNLSATKTASDGLCKADYINVVPDYVLGTNTTASYSQGYIYDNGGRNGNYTNTGTSRQVQGITINSCTDSIFLVFQAFDTRCGLDFIKVYNGTSNKGKLLNKNCAGSTSTDTNGYSGSASSSCAYGCMPNLYTDTFKASKHMYLEMNMNYATSTYYGFKAYYWSKGGTTTSPVASFYTSADKHHDSICVNNVLDFINTSSGSNNTYGWDLDGDLSNGFENANTNAQYPWLFPGNHTVRLVASNCAGADTFVKTIHVFAPPKPKPSFTVDNDRPTLKDAVMLISTTLQCVYYYTWRIKKDSHSSADTGHAYFVLKTYAGSASPSVMFTDTGWYNVTLVASNTAGFDSIVRTDVIQVRPNYCSPSTSANTDIGISRVTFAGIDNVSSQGSSIYTDYAHNTTMAATVQQGVTYAVTVKRDSAFSNAETRAVYIDWLRNGTFTRIAIDSNDSKNATWSTHITVPRNVKTGTVLMRVAATMSGNTLSACNTTYGEYEDYRVNIITDTTRPVIKLKGTDTVVLEVGDLYAEQGYSAYSSYGTVLDSQVVITYPPTKHHWTDNKPLLDTGFYVIYYNVTDSFGNKAVTVKRYVRVNPDMTPPVLTVSGPDTIYVEVDKSSTGYVTLPSVISSMDRVDGTVSYTISPANVRYNKLDTVMITYSDSDSRGNRSIVHRWVIIEDTIAPLITLNGSATVTVDVNTSYTDAGVSYSDNYYSNAEITPLIVSLGAVNIHRLGTYTISYSISDPSHNVSKTIYRNVKVVDTIPPVVTLNGPAHDTLEVNTSYNDPYVKDTDNYYGTARIAKSGTFYSSFSSGYADRLGTYTIIYTAIDSSNNSASVTRTITVIDSIAPVVKLKGSDTVSVCRWSNYTDSGYAASDNYYQGSSIKVISDGTYKSTSVPGTYKLRYVAADSSGNIGYSAYRTVIVESESSKACKSGIKEGLSLDKYISIYPNPTSGQFSVTANLPKEERVVMTVTNTLGQTLAVISNGNLSQNTFTVDLGSQAAGIYMLNIATADDRVSKQIILVK